MHTYKVTIKWRLDYFNRGTMRNQERKFTDRIDAPNFESATRIARIKHLEPNDEENKTISILSIQREDFIREKENE